MTVYVTSLGLDVAFDNQGDAFVTSLGVDVITNPRKRVEVTSLGIDVIQNPRHQVQVTALGIDLIVSVYNGLKLKGVESSSKIGLPSLERLQGPGQPQLDDRESNPFKPSYPLLSNGLESVDLLGPTPVASTPVPSAASPAQSTPATTLPDWLTPTYDAASPTPTTAPAESSGGSSDQILFHMMREQTEQLRQQHEKTQAGDTTMPWEFLTRLSTERLYTLGAQGRFYHDDYGMIVARYVQFSKMIPAEFVNAPAGTLASSDRVDWVVTNDFSRSGPNLVTGIIAAYTLPTEGEYGWVITCGANHTNLKLNAPGLVSQGQDLVWDSFESLSVNGAGTVVGRIWSKKGIANLSPGMVFINLEGPSRGLIESWFNVKFSDLTKRITDLADRVASLEGSTDWTKTIAGIQQDITELEQALREEAGTRQARDAYILGLIQDLGAISQEDLDEVVSQLTLVINNLRDSLYLIIGEMQTQLDAMSAQVAKIPNLQQQIVDLQEALGQLQSQLSRKKTYIPLVTGEIPPVFVYLDDGSLVLVEVDYDGAP